MFSFTKFFAAWAILPALASAAMFDVQVGGANGSLTFEPEAIVRTFHLTFIAAYDLPSSSQYAAVGDQVTFHFNPKNHTVTQSTFEDPCRRLENGFDSGFQFVAADFTGEFPTFNYTVETTAPVWAYCKQRTPVSHCG